MDSATVATTDGEVSSEPLSMPNTKEADSEGEFAVEPHWGKLVKFYGAGRFLFLKEAEFSVGRAPSCDLIISDIDMRGEDLIQISKLHFRIRRRLDGDKQYTVLEDCSTNGTFVNGLRIVGDKKEIILRNTDEISLAKASLKMFMYIDNSTDSQDWFHTSNLCSYFALTKMFHILKTLGSGTYGEVKLTIDVRTFEKCAMKKILKARMPEKKIYNEISILKRLHHPCIIYLEDVFETPEAVFIKLEYISGGNLLDRIMKFKKLNEKETKGTFYQLLMGVQYLHREGVTHRDLKPENILVQLVPDSEYVLVKITDFGLSKAVDDETYMKTTCGTIMYMAPEVLAHFGSPYNHKVDIWSLGVLLYVCLSGEHPFASQDNATDMAQLILNGSYKFKRAAWSNISIEAIHMIKRILVVNPLKRISSKELFLHNWLKIPQRSVTLTVSVNSRYHSEHIIEYFDATLLVRDGTLTLRIV